MSAEAVADLERRAAAAETAIGELSLRLQTMGSSVGAGIEPRLRELLKLMHEDRAEFEAVRAQRDELKEENERLKIQVAKHEYRIKHLLRTIEEISPEENS
ncbi:uncharacterized protein TEOVI_000742200 [Trypanosoma equiperdum]|uniref:Uncharacterized protein n=4 Tax=Trypanozoon TaxID=39700 RepID=Q389X3_TRYB2|nr:hypothetical protein, conserved [Trypanosoma brucei gambiense DAL972]XP_823225.1 hypothetical protein, conserved [Trypanosoma brucei brucei TREU927]RHW69171.1 hypothetical protein DPX39_100107500 [Trypanosoma brucei equiperdum]SCU67995.1 hypothetical protein, conserved [Trypanosoma equiperdum]EAN78397.1 hypothetical protein, conserved [Trypanosoma brucei brucei TREU927]CBH16129.1 hypothetical protein, conserved [Trypanosoma brucei gambiense DAL972]|eukprot:XP_011778393.1 hypothetical protein, conserved [Trypanosoma brucei gambiense DAL972]